MKIGIVEAANLEGELNYLKSWLDNNYNGSMAFLTRDIERRCDPRKIMPDCKSIVVAAMKYDEMFGEDYHVVMMEKLKEIVVDIKREHPDAQCRCYVDTGPVLEKAWGTRAGIGFVGKNTLLISPELGSQMALGIILTNLGSWPAVSCAACFRGLKQVLGGPPATPANYFHRHNSIWIAEWHLGFTKMNICSS